MSRLSKLLVDASTFGFVGATQIQWARSSDKLINLNVPNVGPVSFRSGNSDVETFRQVFAKRQYDIRVPAAKSRLRTRYDEILSSGREPVIIDAGANVGAASLWYSAAWPKARIFALEPEPSTAAVLRLNTKNSDRIEPLEAAIGSRPGYVTMSTPPGLRADGSRSIRTECGTPIMTIDSIVARVSAPSLFIVKVDIEGFEDDLFADNTSWLDEVDCVMIEPHDWMLPDKTTSRNFQREIGKRPFQIFIEDENLIYIRAPGC